MPKKSQKPVKQCDGCELNLGNRCAAFHYPVEKWFKRECEGYGNLELAAHYGLKNDGLGKHAKKNLRRVGAKHQHTIEHMTDEHLSSKKKDWP